MTVYVLLSNIYFVAFLSFMITKILGLFHNINVVNKIIEIWSYLMTGIPDRSKAFIAGSSSFLTGGLKLNPNNASTSIV